MRHKKIPLLTIACLAVFAGPTLLSGCRTPFVPYFLSRDASETVQVREQAAEASPETISDQASTPAPEQLAPEPVSDQSPPEATSDQASAPEQIGEETAAAGEDSLQPTETTPTAEPAETPDTGPEAAAETVPAEIPKPLPELKVKGHF